MRTRYMLIPGERMAKENGVGRIGIERSIGFIGDIHWRQHSTAIERQRPGQGNTAVEAKALIVTHDGEGLGRAALPCQ